MSKLIWLLVPFVREFLLMTVLGLSIVSISSFKSLCQKAGNVSFSICGRKYFDLLQSLCNSSLCLMSPQFARGLFQIQAVGLEK